MRPIMRHSTLQTGYRQRRLERPHFARGARELSEFPKTGKPSWRRRRSRMADREGDKVVQIPAYHHEGPDRFPLLRLVGEKIF